jgi:ribosomal protein S18 acetylase RimI-like enzyme
MNDLVVAEAGRGSGLADRLIAACRERAAAHGAREVAWQTAKDNYRAQKVYDRVGARRSEWLDYSLPVE